MHRNLILVLLERPFLDGGYHRQSRDVSRFKTASNGLVTRYRWNPTCVFLVLFVAYRMAVGLRCFRFFQAP